MAEPQPAPARVADPLGQDELLKTAGELLRAALHVKQVRDRRAAHAGNVRILSSALTRLARTLEALDTEGAAPC